MRLSYRYVPCVSIGVSSSNGVKHWSEEDEWIRNVIDQRLNMLLTTEMHGFSWDSTGKAQISFIGQQQTYGDTMVILNQGCPRGSDPAGIPALPGTKCLICDPEVFSLVEQKAWLDRRPWGLGLDTPGLNDTLAGLCPLFELGLLEGLNSPFRRSQVCVMSPKIELCHEEKDNLYRLTLHKLLGSIYTLWFVSNPPSMTIDYFTFHLS